MPSSILAATVVFTGIICHAQLDSTKSERTALLVDVDVHHPTTMVIDKNDVVSATMTLPAPDATGFHNITLSNHRFVINPGNAPAGVKPSPLFKTSIPHLKQIVDNHGQTPAIHHDIPSGILHKMRASIKYTAGTLSVPSCYEDRVSFPSAPSLGKLCIATGVNLKFVTTTQWEIEDLNNGKKIILKKDATVRVSDESHISGSMGDYLHHADLLESGTVIPWMRNGKCDTGSCTPTTTPMNTSHPSANVDCSSTQWP